MKKVDDSCSSALVRRTRHEETASRREALMEDLLEAKRRILANGSGMVEFTRNQLDDCIAALQDLSYIEWMYE